MNVSGKPPSVKDQLAMLAIMEENTEEHNFNIAGHKKSSVDLLGDVVHVHDLDPLLEGERLESKTICKFRRDYLLNVGRQSKH